MAKQVFYEGSAIKFTVLLNIDTASSATITIDDPTEAVKVDGATMTKDADGVYSYIYQSSTSNEEGDWIYQPLKKEAEGQEGGDANV